MKADRHFAAPGIKAGCRLAELVTEKEPGVYRTEHHVCKLIASWDYQACTSVSRVYMHAMLFGFRRAF